MVCQGILCYNGKVKIWAERLTGLFLCRHNNSKAGAGGWAGTFKRSATSDPETIL